MLKTILTTSIIALAFLSACSDAPGSSEHIIKAIPRKTDSTIQHADNSKFADTIFPVLFGSAFLDGTVAKQDDITFHFYRYDIGQLKIESGRLVAGDPIVLRDVSPFIYKFPIGEFPVQLAVARRDLDSRVAFSRVIFSDSIIVKWEYALKEGQTPMPIGGDSLYCYGVDAGTGVFVDPVAWKAFDEKGLSEWQKVFIKMAEENGYKGFMYSFQDHNLATFSTGWGDGCYATYIGLDKNGAICQVLTDFDLVDWGRSEKKNDIEFKAPL